VIIGGHENKDGDREILEELAHRVGAGKLVIATLASEEPDEQFEQYRTVFSELGVRKIEQLDSRRREDLLDDPDGLLDGAKVIFFAGGDQLKITSRMGGTQLCDQVRELYRKGATLAGTSSGASALSETMMVGGDGDKSPSVRGSLRMAPGLGLIPGVIIDQHFAERGRMGRLLGAIAQNPRMLGIGIDEDTAVIFDRTRDFTVLGSGAVYIVDAGAMTYTNTAEDTEGAASIFGMIVHVLSAHDRFDLTHRKPINQKQSAMVSPRSRRRSARAASKTKG